MASFDAIFYILILILSIVVHEVAHGFAAYREGDQTAYLAGRLTLNPLKHIDLFGSVIVPILLVVTHAPFLFGWAKPVPYNPQNFRNRRKGTILVAAAGVLTNLLVAIVFGFFLRLFIHLTIATPAFVGILSAVITVNLLLAVFNLMPVPPLDGSRILFALLPSRFYRYEPLLERYSLVLVILFVLYGWHFVVPIISKLFSLLTGLALQ